MGARFDRYILAILLIVIGITLVLVNIGLVQVEFEGLWHYVYSVFFIIIGIKWLVSYFRDKNFGWLLGSFFLIFGSLLLFGQLGKIEFSFADIYKLWPLLIAYGGFSLISRQRNRKTISHSSKSGSEAKRFSNYSIGDYQYNKENWLAESIEINNGVGEYLFDFAKAKIPNEEIELKISNLAGEIQIIIPKRLEFQLNAKVNAGEISLDSDKVEGINRSLNYQTDDYEVAIQKITLNLKLKAGSIKVHIV